MRARPRRNGAVPSFRHSFSTPEVTDRINVRSLKFLPFFFFLGRAARDCRKAQLAVATRSADAEGEACSEWSLVCTAARVALFAIIKKKNWEEKEADDKELLDCRWPSESEPSAEMGSRACRERYARCRRNLFSRETRDYLQRDIQRTLEGQLFVFQIIIRPWITLQFHCPWTPVILTRYLVRIRRKKLSSSFAYERDLNLIRLNVTRV